jgi:hypothetical protein
VRLAVGGNRGQRPMKQSDTAVGRARERTSGSHQTRRWRKQSRANPSLNGANFPASWENTGNSSDSGLGDANLPAKRLKGSMAYKQNSLRHGTGN